MANSNAAGVMYVGDQGPDGASFGKATTNKLSAYGVTPVVQASAIVAVTGTVSLTTTMNAVLTVIRNWGLIAS